MPLRSSFVAASPTKSPLVGRSYRRFPPPPSLNYNAPSLYPYAPSLKSTEPTVNPLQ